MTHSICRSEADEGLAYLQRLWRLLLAPNIDPQTRLEQLFEHETAEFDLNNALLSSIDQGAETERFDVVYGSHEELKQGITVPLSETYCRKTIAEPEGTFAVSDALAEGWGDDPAYERFGLGSYLGTTVATDTELYGTLCFMSATPRDEPIRDEEKALVEMYSQWVEYTLALQHGVSVRDSRADTTDARTVSPDDIDLMMDALRTRTRRDILMTLAEHPTGTSLSTLERRLDHENARQQLLHSDLPKLADDGYITWDGDSETISEGPRFPEVKPLVRLLRMHNTTFSE